MSSLFLGAILSIASTSVIVKVLREMKRDREPFAELIYGILIVEDLLGVVMIVLLTGIALTGDLGLQSMAASTGKLLVFLVTVLVVGLLLVPRLLNFRRPVREQRAATGRRAGAVFRHGAGR